MNIQYGASPSTLKSAPPSLVSNFASYGLQKKFRTFSIPQATAPSDFKKTTGISNRGIPAGAIEAALYHDRTKFWTQESSKPGPTYRSLPVRASSMGSMSRPTFSSNFRQSSLSAASLDPFSMTKPIYRSMMISPQPATATPSPHGFGATHMNSPYGFSANNGMKSMYGSAFKATDMHSSSPRTAPKEVLIPPLPSFPYRLERHSSFYTKKSKDSLKISIEAILEKHGADFEFDSQKCKWKVFGYDGTYCAKVVVNIFQVTPDVKSDSNAAMFAVEVQRRQGDAFAFFRWFRPMYNDWVAAGFVCKKDGCAETAAKQQPVAPSPPV